MANESDRRRFGRRPAFKAATIDQGDGQRIPATVLNISEAGAQIKVQPDLIAKEFYLEIPEDDLIVKCRVTRVEETAVAVVFVKPPRRLSWLHK